jgi:predicted DNA-binding transcriptional regulator
MSHVFLMIVEESWVGYDYERLAPPEYIEYGP